MYTNRYFENVWSKYFENAGVGFSACFWFPMPTPAGRGGLFGLLLASYAQSREAGWAAEVAMGPIGIFFAYRYQQKSPWLRNGAIETFCF